MLHWPELCCSNGKYKHIKSDIYQSINLKKTNFYKMVKSAHISEQKSHRGRTSGSCLSIFFEDLDLAQPSRFFFFWRTKVSIAKLKHFHFLWGDEPKISVSLQTAVALRLQSQHQSDKLSDMMGLWEHDAPDLCIKKKKKKEPQRWIMQKPFNFPTTLLAKSNLFHVIFYHSLKKKKKSCYRSSSL